MRYGNAILVMLQSALQMEPNIPSIVLLAQQQRKKIMKGIVAWFMGVPVVVIILLYVFGFF